MFTKSENICNLCKKKTKIIYIPIKSERGTTVTLCKFCLTVQSYQKNIKRKIHKTISGDADWGNVRHGKGLRFETIKKIFNLHKYISNGNSILDIGSSRNDFSYWAKENFNNINITRFETDKSLNKINKNELVHTKYEDFEPGKKKYEFIYCCQTLEHVDDPFFFLKKIKSELSKGGIALIDVPNIAAINYIHLIEEFFIDKHVFHFSEESMKNYFSKVGLHLVSEHIDKFNMTFLLKKMDNLNQIKPTKNFNKTTKEIKDYELRIKKNRKKLKLVVEKIINPLLRRQKCAFWGISKIFNTLCSYGNLQRNKEMILFDTYLHDKYELPFLKIYHPSYIKIFEPQVIFILANSNEDFLANKAYELGVRHVIKFSEMMDQV